MTHTEVEHHREFPRFGTVAFPLEFIVGFIAHGGDIEIEQVRIAILHGVGYARGTIILGAASHKKPRTFCYRRKEVVVFGKFMLF